MVPAAKLSITTSERATRRRMTSRAASLRRSRRQAALVGVVDLEQAVGVGRGLDVGRVERQPAEQAEVLGRLQADDVGAEVGEQLGAVWAGPDPGEVADADALERARAAGRHPARPAGRRRRRALGPALAVLRARLRGGAAQRPTRAGRRWKPGPGQRAPVGIGGEEARGCGAARRPASWSMR